MKTASQNRGRVDGVAADRVRRDSRAAAKGTRRGERFVVVERAVRDAEGRLGSPAATRDYPGRAGPAGDGTTAGTTGHHPCALHRHAVDRERTVVVVDCAVSQIRKKEVLN